MFLKTLVLAVLLAGGIVGGENCDELNYIFGDTNSAFLKCILGKNVNATFCEDCMEQYANVTVAFNNLMTKNETNKHLKPEPCRSHYVDGNQLDLVETIFGYSKRLWEIGDCSGQILSIECDSSLFNST